MTTYEEGLVINTLITLTLHEEEPEQLMVCCSDFERG